MSVSGGHKFRSSYQLERLSFLSISERTSKHFFFTNGKLHLVTASYSAFPHVVFSQLNARSTGPSLFEVLAFSRDGNIKSGCVVTFLWACPSSKDHLERFSSVSPESFHNFAFLRKLLAQYVCCHREM